MKVTEINPKRSDFLKNIRLTESRIGLKAELFFNNGKTQESHLQFAQNGIVEYIYENGCLIENSKFIKNNDNTITQIFTNGESRTFDNIKNNEALPDKITFDPSVEPWNDETCQ